MLVIIDNPHVGAGPCDPRVQGTLRNTQLGREGSVFPGGLLFLALEQQHKLTEGRVTSQRAESLAVSKRVVGV